MEHLYSGGLCFHIIIWGQHGKVDGFRKVFREELCQILVVGIDDVFLDSLDFRLIYFGKHGIYLFPSVPVCVLRVFPYGGANGVDAVCGFRACHRFGYGVNSF